jgi:CHAD domain-containing protein
MAQSAQSAHPLQTLREATESLEAAILVCLDNPDKDGVHRLRTTTRRIQAQLELLTMLPNLPPHQKQSRKALRLLKKLRRAAGRVRDLDVQRDLIEKEAAGNNGGSTPELRKEADYLRRTLRHKRDEEAARLQQILNQHRADFPLVFERLLDCLAPASSLALTETRLTALIREWYAEHTPDSTSAPQEIAQLHNIRKRAKIARYLAESAPESAASARRLAAHFEDLQQAGGKWHDWLLLAQLSLSELGKAAKLPQRFSVHADNSLRAFKRRLTQPASRPAAQHARAA